MLIASLCTYWYQFQMLTASNFINLPNNTLVSVTLFWVTAARGRQNLVVFSERVNQVGLFITYPQARPYQACVVEFKCCEFKCCVIEFKPCVIEFKSREKMDSWNLPVWMRVDWAFVLVSYRARCEVQLIIWLICKSWWGGKICWKVVMLQNVIVKKPRQGDVLWKWTAEALVISAISLIC